MIRQQDEAFVLGTQPLGDADLIVSFLTESHGRLRAVARSARRSRRRFGGRLEPLTHVRVSWVEREGRELHRLEQLEAVRSFAEMQAEPRCQAACAVLAEVTTAFASDGQADPEEFRLVGAVLQALERGGPPKLLLRYFEYWTLRVHGLLPDLEACAACGRPLDAGRTIRVSSRRGPLCAECPRLPSERDESLRRADRSFLESARRQPPEAIAAALGSSRPGPGLETLLRGTLESFAERRFRTYRHFKALDLFPAGGDPA